MALKLHKYNPYDNVKGGSSMSAPVERLIIGSYTATFGLNDGEEVTYHVAFDADTERMLRDTESTAFGDTLDLVQRLYRGAEIVATITAVEAGGRL